MRKLNIKGLKKKAGGALAPSPLQIGAGTIFPYSQELMREHSYFDKYNEPYVNYKVIGKGTDNPKLALPRALYPDAPKDLRVLGDKVKYNWKGVPRNPEQERVLQEIDESMEAGESGYIVNASTGFGKTFIGCYGIYKVGRPALVLITKADLQEQWEESFEQFLGIPYEDVGLIKGDVYDVLGKKVVLAYVQSVMKDGRYPSWVYKQFGLVIGDEIHLLGAEKFVNCMYVLPAYYRVGLSATIKRPDGKAHVFRDHIGKRIIKADLLPMKFDVVKIKTGLKIPPHVKYKAGRTMQLNVYLGGVKSRQLLITQKIKKCLAKDRNIVCFADTLEHLNFAYDSLIDEGVPHSKIGFYVGGMAKGERDLNAHKKVVLTTYKMTQYGTDYPHWDTAMFMTPRSDVVQITGRILRELEGKTNPLVFDFVDNAKLLYAYWGKRRKWYIQKANRIIE